MSIPLTPSPSSSESTSSLSLIHPPPRSGVLKRRPRTQGPKRRDGESVTKTPGPPRVTLVEGKDSLGPLPRATYRLERLSPGTPEHPGGETRL